MVTIITRRRARPPGPGRGRRRRRAGRVAGDHEQRDAGRAGPRGHAVPDGAAQEPARRDARRGRDHHHDQPRVGEPLRPRLGGQGVLRQQRQDRLGRGRHGRVGPHRRGHHGRRPTAPWRRSRSSRGQGVPRLDARGHRRHRVHRGPARAPGDADPAARLDDGSAAALGRGRVRGGRGPDERRHRGHRRTCWASAWTSVSSRSTGTSRTARSSSIEGERDAQELLRGSSRASPNVGGGRPSSRSAPATSRRSARRPRRAASATSTSRWATTGTPIPAARTRARSTSTGSSATRRSRSWAARRLHLPRRRMGRVSSVRVVPLADVLPIDLPRRQLEPRAPDRRRGSAPRPRSGYSVVRARDCDGDAVARDRGARLRRRAAGVSSGSTMSRCPIRRGRPCTSRPASGTRW